MSRAALIAVLVVGCSTSPRPAPKSLSDLRFSLASEPGSVSARRGLAVALQSEGQRGAALQHWLNLDSRSELRDKERESVAAMLVERAGARLERGDAGALADIDHALSLHPASVDDGMMDRAQRMYIAHRLIVASSPELGPRSRAWRLAKRLMPTLVLGPRKASVDAAGDIGRWMWRRNARVAARAWLASYADRGGTDAPTLRAHLAAQRWWRGSTGTIPRPIIDRVLAAGELDCGLADRGCPDVVRVVEDDSLAAELWRRTDGRVALTTDPAEAAGWVAATLRVWLLDGDRGWLIRLGERVDVAAVVERRDVPIFAAPTLLRAAGRPRRASDALDLALELFAKMPSGQRTVVVAELVATQDPRLATVATAMGLPRGARDIIRRLAKRREGADPGGALEPLFARALNRCREMKESSCSKIVAAYAVEPARADALARLYVNAEILRTARAIEVADLFRDLGDLPRYLRWTELAASESPLDAEAQYRRGLAAVVAGTASQANLHFATAASLSGDRGAVYARAAFELEQASKPLAALSVGRRALPLRAAGTRRALYDVLIRASTSLGRLQQARALAAERTLATTPIADPTDIDWAVDRGDAQRLAFAAKLNPGAPRPRVALLRTGSAPERARAARELAEIATTGPRAKARIAARALVRYYSKRGEVDRSTAYERLARAL